MCPSLCQSRGVECGAGAAIKSGLIRNAAKESTTTAWVVLGDTAGSPDSVNKTTAGLASSFEEVYQRLILDQFISLSFLA